MPKMFVQIMAFADGNILYLSIFVLLLQNSAGLILCYGLSGPTVTISDILVVVICAVYAVILVSRVANLAAVALAVKHSQVAEAVLFLAAAELVAEIDIVVLVSVDAQVDLVEGAADQGS
jgi:tryptophan-rich sensory protein